MKQIDYSKLRTGQILCVCNGNPSFFPHEIQKVQNLEFPWEIAKYHHIGKIYFNAGKWWVVEEKRISGVANTLLDEYLKKDENSYIIREPLKLTERNSRNFAYVFTRDVNSGHYFIGGIIKQAYHFIAFKITGKQKWLNIGNDNNDDYICSTQCAKWDNEVLGLFEDNWYKMSPADYVITTTYKTVMTL